MTHSLTLSRFALFALLTALTAAGCGDDSDSEPGSSSSNESARCDTCGMIIAPDDGWRAGAAGLVFDSPKCMFRHAHRHGALEQPWVIEYYSQERRDAREMLYVTGTDLESPMGVDLVPVEGAEAAERLRTDHGGERVLAFDAVDAELVEALFR